MNSLNPPAGLDPKIFSDLEARGLVKQSTDPDLPQVLAREPLTLYAGFDPTADSLHVGHMLPLITLRRFQLAGHRVIAVMGGATGMIGDPSGRAAERTLMTPDQIDHNVAGIRKIVERFLDLSDPSKGLIVNNADFFKGLTFIDFLRDVGKHFTINHMLAKESVRSRLEDREHGISFTEFSYMLLQAFDFYSLNSKESCRLQIGGSDQWGNITAGIELIRRMRAQAHAEGTGTGGRHPISQGEVYGLTLPLVLKSDGTKFGKSESGAVWLTEELTSAYQLYQFFVQTPDSDVGTYLRYFTFLPVPEIERLEAAVKTAPEKREAQTSLAREMVKIIHGEESLTRSEAASKALFGTEIKNLDARTLADVFAGAPVTEKARSALASPGWPLIDALVESGLCASKGASRKEVQGGGVYVNNERTSDPAMALLESHLIAGGSLVLRRGKKTYHLVKFTS